MGRKDLRMRIETNIKLKPWFIESHISEDKDCLFVFHHAGGGASYYTSLFPYLNQDFNIYLIQLPGREYRIKEKAYDKLEDLLEDLESTLLPYLDRPFMFLGHSMGAMLAFELTNRIKRAHGKRPKHLFLSSMRAPHLSTKEDYHLLSDKQLLSKIFDLGGTGREISQDEKLMSLILPTLRKDLALCDNYRCSNNLNLDIPVTILGGNRDDAVSVKDLLAWNSYFGDEFKVRLFDGGHFYFRDSFEELTSIILEEKY